MLYAEPLTPQLYQGLVRHVGPVRIVNPGRPLSTSASQWLTIMDDDDCERIRIDDPGEYYVLSCPFCNDARQRLWINHEWLRYPFLAICYNENCLADVVNRSELRRRVTMYSRPSVPASPRPKRAIKLSGPPSPPPVVTLPTGTVSLVSLTESHPAKVYLKARGFDPDEIATRYGVVYAASYVPHLPMVMGRLVIPIYCGGKLIGWQARATEDPSSSTEWGPKYYTMPGFAKSHMLYNIDAARHIQDVVICEGVTDVWNVGHGAVALLGKTVSDAQRSLLGVHWARKGGKAVVLLDSDAQLRPNDEAWFKQFFPARHVVVALPTGHDPGSLPRGDLHHLIQAAARTANLGEIAIAETGYGQGQVKPI